MKYIYNQRTIFDITGKSPPMSELRVVLLGSKRSGKSSSGNTLLGRDAFDLMESTPQCVMRQGEVAGRQVTVVKAPGWWRLIGYTTELKKQEIVLSVSHCPPGPHIVLLLIGIQHFLTDVKYAIPEFLEFLSE